MSGGDEHTAKDLLRRLPDLAVTLLSNGDAVIKTGRETILAGPHALAVLDLFRHPRSLADALAAVEARGVQDFIDASSLILELRRAGALVDAHPSSPAEPARLPGFDSPFLHATMLDDDVRTHAFLRAIQKVVRKGDVVVDIGTGTGILAVAAAQAGARHVYAIESGSVALAARDVVAANGLEDRVTILHGRSTAITLPERADVLVTETIGNDPFDEGIIDTVRDARRRLLKPGARVIPESVAALFVPVEVPLDFLDRCTILPEQLARWREAYGVELGPLAAYAVATSRRARVLSSEACTWTRVGDAVTVADASFRPDAEETSAIEAEADLRITTATTHLGVLGYFESVIAPGVNLSTAPNLGAPASWDELLHYVAARPSVVAGDVVHLHYACSNGRPVVRVT